MLPESFRFGSGHGKLSSCRRKPGVRSRTATVIASSKGEQKQVDLVLEESGTARADSSAGFSQAMEFADKPTFIVAGVTDWTAVGGHGSDSTLRTSEYLARETLTLKPEEAGTASRATAMAVRFGS